MEGNVLRQPLIGIHLLPQVPLAILILEFSVPELQRPVSTALGWGQWQIISGQQSCHSLVVLITREGEISGCVAGSAQD